MSAKEKEKRDKPAKAERPTNCAGCNKHLVLKTRYYRNGKYYCNKRCYKQSQEKK